MTVASQGEENHHSRGGEGKGEAGEAPTAAAQCCSAHNNSSRCGPAVEGSDHEARESLRTSDRSLKQVSNKAIESFTFNN